MTRRRATCAHGAPWYRNDCPGCLDTAPDDPPVWAKFDKAMWQPWWGWTDNSGNVTCGPCGALLKPDFTHQCPGALP